MTSLSLLTAGAAGGVCSDRRAETRPVLSSRRGAYPSRHAIVITSKPVCGCARVPICPGEFILSQLQLQAMHSRKHVCMYLHTTVC